MKGKSQSSGPPRPTIALTLQQEMELRRIEIQINKPQARKEDIITVFMALQEQNFVLQNCVNQLLKWQKS